MPVSTPEGRRVLGIVLKRSRSCKCKGRDKLPTMELKYSQNKYDLMPVKVL